MIQKLFSVRDSKAGVFNTPFFKPTQAEAERDFHRLAHDPSSMVEQYPEDFDLYYIGEFNQNTGKLKTLETPEHIVKATLVQKQNAQRLMQQPTAEAVVQ